MFEAMGSHQLAELGDLPAQLRFALLSMLDFRPRRFLFESFLRLQEFL
jgi:hypothetical protein